MAPTQSEVSGAARKLRSNLEIIADSYSIDTSYCLIPSRVEVWPFKLSVMVLSYILGQNTILVGEPGFGKTVSAKTVASVMTRLPYDLYSATQIQATLSRPRHRWLEGLISTNLACLMAVK